MISNLCYWISRIAKDKILHYLVSYIIVDFFLNLFIAIDLLPEINIMFTLLIVSVAIFGKEIIDHVEYGNFDWKDILAGYLGVMTKLLIFFVTIL